MRSHPRQLGRVVVAMLGAVVAVGGLAPVGAMAAALPSFAVGTTTGAVYGGDLTLTATATPSDATGDVTFAFDGVTIAPAVALAGGIASVVIAGPSVGTHTYSASYAGEAYDPATDGPYDVTVTTAPLVVAADGSSRPFGIANPPLTATITGFVNGETLGTSGVTGSPTCTTDATPMSPAGNYLITCSAGSLAALNYGFTFVGGTLAVTPAGASVSVTGGTFLYSGTPHAATGFAHGNGGTGDVLSPVVTFSYTGTGGTTYGPTATPPTGAGSYVATAAFAGNAEYGPASGDAALTITKAPLTGVVDNASRPYGAPNPAFSTTLLGLVNGETLETSGVTGSPECTTAATTDSPAGTYPVSCTVGSLAAANYGFGPPAGGTLLTVTRAPLTVTANGASRPFGVEDPPFAATITGFVNGETRGTSGVTGSPTCSTSAGLTSPAGSYPITCSAGSLSALNYSFTFVGGTLAVVRGASSVALSTAATVIEVSTPVTLVALVEPEAAGATPSGTVVFTIDGAERSPVALDADGRASVSVTWATIGVKKVSAAYSGDASFAPPGTASLAPTVVANTARGTGIRLSSTSVYPVVDGWHDTVTARGIRSERLALAIAVRNAKGTVIRRFSAGSATGPYAWAWNGRTSTGAMAPAGRYTIVQTLIDPYGSRPRLTVTSSVVLSLRKMQWMTTTIAASPGPRCYQFSTGDGVGPYSCSSTAPLRLAGVAGRWPGIGYELRLPSATAYRSIRVEVQGTFTGPQPAIGLHDWKLATQWGELYRADWIRTKISPTTTRWSGVATSDFARYVSGRRVRAYVDGGGRLAGPFRFDVARVRLVVTYGILR
jgi:hypothetical protein